MEVAAYREPLVLGRKRAFVTREAKIKASSTFGTVGSMPDTERTQEILRQRFRSELIAVRGLLEKAAAALSPSSPTPPPRVVKHSRHRGFLAAEPRSEEPPAKKIKASPSALVIKRKKMAHGERERLKADLEKLASELPDHIMELLKKLSRGVSDGEMEIDISSVPDEALLELRQLLDEFVRGRANPSPQQHQDGKLMDEEEEDVDIVGGVSPLAIAPAPLQLAEDEDEYVDICGDASPVVISKKLGDDATIRSSTSSVSDSDSDPDESIGSLSRAERDAELIFRANMEYLERSKAREKARQEVLETERTAMPNDTIHPTVLKSLGIDEENMVIPLRRLRLFLKADNYGGVEEQQHHRHRQIFQEDLEEGEIR